MNYYIKILSQDIKTKYSRLVAQINKFEKFHKILSGEIETRPSAVRVASRSR